MSSRPDTRRAPKPLPDTAELDDIVGRIRRVPDRYRDFRRAGAAATLPYGISAELLDALTALGLPHRSVAGATSYDNLDLTNISLSLALPSPRLMAMRGWAAALRSTGRATPAALYTVQVVPTCPQGPHESPCMPEASPVLRCLPGFVPPVGGGTIALTRQIQGHAAEVFPELAEVTDLVRAVHFHHLPSELREDVGFLREARLADCGLAATYLAEEATKRGLRARRSFGLFLAAPYSFVHSWLEVELDGRWNPFDPHLLNLLTAWRLLPAEEWPSYRTLGQRVWRLGKHEVTMATHDGTETPLSFPTRIENITQLIREEL